LSEENSVDFYQGAAGNEEKVAQLAVLRFHIKATIGSGRRLVSAAPRRELARTKGWSPKVLEQAKRLVAVGPYDSDPKHLCTNRKTPDRMRGVMLQNKPDGNGALATLYEFQEGRR